MSKHWKGERRNANNRYLDVSMEHAKRQWSAYYFVAQTVHLSLALMAESLPVSHVGLILPLQKRISRSAISLENISSLGLSLIGWLEEDGSCHLLLDSAPDFKYKNDFHIELLPLTVGQGGAANNSALLVVPRKTGTLSLPPEVTETMRILLTFIQNSKQDWHQLFREDSYHRFTPMNRMHNGTSFPDALLNALADMVIRLGNFTHMEQKKWQFCCLLRPAASWLPIQQQNLVVAAKSEGAPHHVNVTTVSPNEDSLCLSLRAYQSGAIHHIDDVTVGDTIIKFLTEEGPVRSAVAMPIGGEHGEAIAVLYVVSYEPGAFSFIDLSVLRLIGKMIENLLATYNGTQKILEHLVDIVKNPQIVDTHFTEFSTENDFRRDVRLLLQSIFTRHQGQQHHENISFIAVAVDDASNIVRKFSGATLRNLNRDVGFRIKARLRNLFEEYPLYYVYGDTFYLLLKDTPLPRAQERALTLINTLSGQYHIDASNTAVAGPNLAEHKLLIPEVTVRLVVTSYGQKEMVALIEQHEEDVNMVSIKIRSALERGLKIGEERGGNIIMALSQGTFVRWPPES